MPRARFSRNTTRRLLRVAIGLAGCFWPLTCLSAAAAACAGVRAACLGTAMFGMKVPFTERSCPFLSKWARSVPANTGMPE